jgi:hypothetical protein
MVRGNLDYCIKAPPLARQWNVAACLSGVGGGGAATSG